MKQFILKTKLKPAGDQPQAIDFLTNGIESGAESQTLLGVTGSGKTFTMANVIERTQKPTLVLAHNKTLAAQLFSEFREYFPDNAVRYFVSYYDYYQPEAYVAKRDLYIEKEADINEDIERYRSAATQALLTRKDTIIVASVSCIYGLGNPEDYLSLSRTIENGLEYNREKLLRHLADLQYERSEYEFYNGMYRIRGDSIDIYTASEETAVRLEFFGNKIEVIKIINPLSGEILDKPKSYTIFPAKQYVTAFEALKLAIPKIRKDLEAEVKSFRSKGKELEAQRLDQRVNYDLEMLEETGYVAGIENYSRYIERRPIGSPPSTLLDYFPDDYLMFIDESHITVPQVRGMYKGDRSRKESLVEYGFRLKAALDNRPLKFVEFNSKLNQTIYVSATPSDYEKQLSLQSIKKLKGLYKYTGIAEQVVRPTGLLDPVIDIRPTESSNFCNIKKIVQENGYFDFNILNRKESSLNQIDDLTDEIQKTIKKGQRVLVTTLTKRMAEDLSAFLKEIKIKVQYIHSDIDAIERVDILRDLRLGKYDVLVGINLLREGLDLPEVSLVAILDADKEGFLRSDVSLIQTMGRAARHQDGKVIMYADKITGSMKRAIDEVRRRRKTQKEYNKTHGIVPKTIQKEIKDQLTATDKHEEIKGDVTVTSLKKRAESYKAMTAIEKNALTEEIKVQMSIFADLLEFEKAAEMRDLLNNIK
ncbi:excinuclease ABC subunit UvrB [Candidatus Dojkabacteria bacterium]|nr:excinuclease ABC subunit UvrB [Candidatus Dojkabacteria bacterium]